MNVPSSEPARLVSTLSGYGLSWIDVQPDLRELRLQFIAGVKEPRYVLHFFGISKASFSLQPGNEPPYTVADAILTDCSGALDTDTAGPLRFHVEGEVIVDIVCRNCTVYSERLSRPPAPGPSSFT